MAERGYCSIPEGSRCSASANWPRSMTGNTEKRYCCSSVDGAWPWPFIARNRMRKPSTTRLTYSVVPIHNDRICQREVSTAGTAQTWRVVVGTLGPIVLLLVLMLWNAGGAPAGVASEAMAHLGKG